MRVIKEVLPRQPLADLLENVGEQVIVQVDGDLAPLVASAHYAQQYLVGLDLHVERGLPTE